MVMMCSHLCNVFAMARSRRSHQSLKVNTSPGIQRLLQHTTLQHWFILTSHELLTQGLPQHHNPSRSNLQNSTPPFPPSTPSPTPKLPLPRNYITMPYINTKHALPKPQIRVLPPPSTNPHPRLRRRPTPSTSTSQRPPNLAFAARSCRRRNTYISIAQGAESARR
jgi:hypothetical protein